MLSQAFNSGIKKAPCRLHLSTPLIILQLWVTCLCWANFRVSFINGKKKKTVSISWAVKDNETLPERKLMGVCLPGTVIPPLRELAQLSPCFWAPWSSAMLNYRSPAAPHRPLPTSSTCSCWCLNLGAYPRSSLSPLFMHLFNTYLLTAHQVQVSCHEADTQWWTRKRRWSLPSWSLDGNRDTQLQNERR